MQSSAAFNASLGLWPVVHDDCDDEAPTREFVVHRATIGELDDEPDVFAFELNRREAASAALMELYASDLARDDGPPTIEFVVPRYTALHFSQEQLDALLALEANDDELAIDFAEPRLEFMPAASATLGASAHLG